MSCQEEFEMGFLNEFDKATTVKETENGALAYTTTDSKMVDFFAAIGGMRQRDEKDIIDINSHRGHAHCV